MWFTFVQTVSDGLQVKFMEYNGCIHKRHLPKSPTSYNIGQKVRAIILREAILIYQGNLDEMQQIIFVNEILSVTPFSSSCAVALCVPSVLLSLTICFISQVEARVLYTAALTKEIHLSLLPRVVNCIGVEPQPMPMSVGDVGEWEVLHVEQNRGVYFQAQGITGFAPVRIVFHKSI